MDKRFWLASLAAFVIQFAALYVINVYVLMSTWIASAGNILRYWDVDPEGGLAELEVYHFMVIPFILWAIMSVYFYRAVKKDGPWLSQGAVFGLLFALTTVVPMRLFTYATFKFSDGTKFVPSPVLLQEMVLWTVALIVSGIVVAWFYRKPA